VAEQVSLAARSVDGRPVVTNAGHGGAGVTLSVGVCGRGGPASSPAWP